MKNGIQLPSFQIKFKSFIRWLLPRIHLEPHTVKPQRRTRFSNRRELRPARKSQMWPLTAFRAELIEPDQPRDIALRKTVWVRRWWGGNDPNALPGSNNPKQHSSSHCGCNPYGLETQPSRETSIQVRPSSRAPLREGGARRTNSSC